MDEKLNYENAELRAKLTSDFGKLSPKYLNCTLYGN